MACLQSADFLHLLTASVPVERKKIFDEHFRDCVQCRHEMARLRSVGFLGGMKKLLSLILVGSLCGGLGALLCILAFAGELLHNLSHVYDEFPSLPRPWLAKIDLPSMPPLIAVAIVITLSMGLLSSLLMRASIWKVDVVAGLATGLAASVAAYLTGIGWTVLLALAVVPPIEDTRLLAEHALEKWTAIYPDLNSAPEAERPKRLFRKIVAQQVAGTFKGVWLGVLLCLAFYLPMAMGQSLAAGYLLRRGDHWLALFFEYGELALFGTTLITFVVTFGIYFSVTQVGMENRQTAEWAIVLFGCESVTAAIAISHRWILPARWCVYFAWLALIPMLFDRASLVPGERGPIITLGLAGSATAVLVLYFIFRALSEPKPIKQSERPRDLHSSA